MTNYHIIIVLELNILNQAQFGALNFVSFVVDFRFNATSF